MCGGARSFLILGILFRMKQTCDLLHIGHEKIEIEKKVVSNFEIRYGF
jgi:hypothetical protein